MDAQEFKKDFLERIKSAAAVIGEGSCAAFVDNTPNTEQSNKHQRGCTASNLSRQLCVLRF